MEFIWRCDLRNDARAQATRTRRVMRYLPATYNIYVR